ncbi:SRPBCC family protein [Microlunatus ginsengisoli]|uniref:Carbon monoxide dehydrogenase subunit G n=1 Tax=Microlunatus ginsengisoli TaxID=363863 RepID=A0ABP7A8G8_9ACTN
MDLTHRFSVPAPLDEAWRAFNDLEGLAPCFPGATLSSVEGDEFAGSVKVKLGPIALLYNGTGHYVQRDEDAHRVVIEARGKDKRGNGTATATVTASFAAGADGTDVEVVTDLAITGKPAQFGRGVISDVSDKLLAQFVACVSGRFAAAESAPEPEVPAAPPGSETPGSEPPGSEPPGSTEPSGATDVDSSDEAPGSAEPGGAAGQGESRSEPPVAPAPEPVPSHQPPPPSPPAPPRTSSPPPRPGAPSQQPAADEVNLLATVAPVLLKRYGPVVLGLGLVLLAVIAIVRRRSSHKHG